MITNTWKESSDIAMQNSLISKWKLAVSVFWVTLINHNKTFIELLSLFKITSTKRSSVAFLTSSSLSLINALKHGDIFIRNVCVSAIFATCLKNLKFT